MLIDIFNLALESLVTILLVRSITKNKSSKIIKNTIIYVLASIILIMSINILNISSMWTLCNSIFLFLYIHITYKESYSNSIILCIVCIVLCGILQLVCYTPLSLVHDKVISDEYANILVNFMCLIITFILYKKMDLSKIINFIQEKNVLSKAIITICIVAIFKGLFTFKLHHQLALIDYVIILSSVLIICITTIQWQKTKYEVKQKNRVLQMNKIYEGAFKELIDKIRARQHEFDNHINTILFQHLTIHTYDELVKAQNQYCESIVKSPEYYNLLLVNHPIIAGFLYSKFSKGSSLNIHTDYTIAFKAIEEYMNVADIIEIVGTLLDNAYEAIKNLEMNEKVVNFQLHENNDILSIVVKNPFEYIPNEELIKFFKRGYSTKGVSNERGIGLFNTKQIVTKYKGTIRVINENLNKENYISFYITIPQKKKSISN